MKLSFREPLLLDRFPLEQKLLGDCLVTSYCDMVCSTFTLFRVFNLCFQIEFRPLENNEEVFHLAVASPHLLAIDREELLFRFCISMSSYLRSSIWLITFPLVAVIFCAFEAVKTTNILV